MTTFAELASRVDALSKRPDLTVQRNIAIAMATMKAHHTDFFLRDFTSYIYTYTISNTYKYQVMNTMYSTLIRLRAIKVIHFLDYGNYALTDILNFREVDNLLDHETGAQIYGVFTEVGEQLRMYGLIPTGRAEILYYKNPIVSEAEYSSWIADNHPNELATWAAAIMLNRMGNETQAKQMVTDIVKPFQELLMQSYVRQEVH